MNSYFYEKNLVVGLVAQLVEQSPEKACVAGSIPAETTKALKMTISITNLIGFFAAFCTTIAFLPQAIKVYKSKSTKDISLWMFLIFTTGVLSWLIYGFMISDLPIIFANTVTLLLSIFILIYKIKFK